MTSKKLRGRRPSSTSVKIKRMIEVGATNQEIIAKLNCNPQLVYSVRYHHNKSKGIGALSTKAKPPIIQPPQDTSSSLPPPVPVPEPFQPEPLLSVWQRVLQIFSRKAR